MQVTRPGCVIYEASCSKSGKKCHFRYWNIIASFRPQSLSSYQNALCLLINAALTLAGGCSWCEGRPSWVPWAPSHACVHSSGSWWDAPDWCSVPWLEAEMQSSYPVASAPTTRGARPSENWGLHTESTFGTWIMGGWKVHPHHWLPWRLRQ